MFSFVNGFLCTCSCDVSKARRGVDPHPKSDDAQSPAKQAKDGIARNADEAVRFGGSLAAASSAAPATSANVVTAASAAQPSAQIDAQAPGQIINLVA